MLTCLLILIHPICDPSYDVICKIYERTNQVSFLLVRLLADYVKLKVFKDDNPKLISYKVMSIRWSGLKNKVASTTTNIIISFIENMATIRFLWFLINWMQSMTQQKSAIYIMLSSMLRYRNVLSWSVVSLTTMHLNGQKINTKIWPAISPLRTAMACDVEPLTIGTPKSASFSFWQQFFIILEYKFHMIIYLNG